MILLMSNNVIKRMNKKLSNKINRTNKNDDEDNENNSRIMTDREFNFNQIYHKYSKYVLKISKHSNDKKKFYFFVGDNCSLVAHCQLLTSKITHVVNTATGFAENYTDMGASNRTGITAVNRRFSCGFYCMGRSNDLFCVEPIHLLVSSKHADMKLV
ncbi:unnamed protein product [Rotaria socialis]|uniref:Uncharacterized protein n=2 Tax=Rotaria socialis TaxID=392032 RepID=A0A817TE43_9BILA|nr:unnamed protein product [Rotaria socialis]CAF3403967.1 unnamed protein product [Rotaria socialis]CAF3627569.1 unnamed protein product [Rotaria socialis]